MNKEIILTGDRTNSKKYEMFIMIADVQALTDNFDNIEKVKNNITEVLLDYLAVGLEPSKVHFVLQSGVPAIFELPMYYANLVSINRLKRNPTVKSEIAQKGFGESVPAGFVYYPISQAADITAFDATCVPVGEDQLPVIEQCHEIVDTFNRLYGETLVMPKAVVPSNKACLRLVGTDGNAKMSKSLGNCIYLKDEPEVIQKKVMSMYTDPNHINITDKGDTKNNAVFKYLEAFCTKEHFAKYLPEYENLDQMKAHYERGGLGDVKCKKFLNSILQEILEPIRKRREEYALDLKRVYSFLEQGTQFAVEHTNKVLARVRNAIGVNFFERVKK